MSLPAVLLEAWQSLGAKRSRSIATALTVALGVGLSISSVAIGQSGQQQVQTEFDAQRSQDVSLLDISSAAADPDTRGFADDLEGALQLLIPGVVSAGLATELESTPVSPIRATGGSGVPVGVVGLDWGALEASSEVNRGLWHDADCDRRIGLIGLTAAERIGVSVDPAQPTTIEINGIPIALVGTLATDSVFDDKVVVPECVARSTGLKIGSRRLLIRVQQGYADVVALRAPYAVRPGSPETVEASYIPNQRGLRQIIESTTRNLILALGASVALLSALIMGFANAAAVAERRAEMGLRRVFGARPRDIYAQLLAEALIVGLMSGLLGATIGMAGVYVAATALDWILVIDGLLFVAGPLVGCLVGVIAGIYPAVVASKVQPRAALQQF